jgi:DNA-binding transcriptional regulator/RsmH inhibitor MraZ
MWVVGGYILGYSGLQWVTHEGRKKRTTMDYFKRKLDDKNRLTIPAEVRRELAAGKVILTPGFNNYLHLYTQEVWEGEMRQALSGSWKTEGDRPAILDQELADLTDRFLDGQQVTVLDQKQGRITIEPDLLERAGFDRIKDVVATRIYTPTGSYWRLKTPRT